MESFTPPPALPAVFLRRRCGTQNSFLSMPSSQFWHLATPPPLVKGVARTYCVKQCPVRNPGSYLRPDGPMAEKHTRTDVATWVDLTRPPAPALVSKSSSLETFRGPSAMILDRSRRSSGSAICTPPPLLPLWGLGQVWWGDQGRPRGLHALPCVRQLNSGCSAWGAP